jgi:hypothetical protein
MKPEQKLYKEVRHWLHHQLWDNAQLLRPTKVMDEKPLRPNKQYPAERLCEKWRLACGEGRYKETARNAAFSRSTGVALNFQIVGLDEHIERFEICLIWPCGWRLMYHNDPKQAAWPHHPESHIQFQPSPEKTPVPFAEWRLPFAETDPLRILEYVHTHLS